MLAQPQARVRGLLTDLVFQLGVLGLNTFVLFMQRASGHFVCVAFVSWEGKRKSAWRTLLICGEDVDAHAKIGRDHYSLFDLHVDIFGSMALFHFGVPKL